MLSKSLVCLRSSVHLLLLERPRPLLLYLRLLPMLLLFYIRLLLPMLPPPPQCRHLFLLQL
jgi:hypothetical protein